VENARMNISSCSDGAGKRPRRPRSDAGKAHNGSVSKKDKKTTEKISIQMSTEHANIPTFLLSE